MCISGSSGVGKTHFAYNLIKNKLSGNKIKHVIYFGCLNSKKPLNWHKKFPQITVTYKEGIPNREFFESLKPKSLVVIDDMYDDAINSKDISHAFRVTRRHLKFSIILISHNLFEPGKYGKTIRQNCEQFCLFTNYGDVNSNARAINQLGMKSRYDQWLSDTAGLKHAYILYNLSPKVESNNLRVGWNLFGEFTDFGPFPIFYTD